MMALAPVCTKSAAKQAQVTDKHSMRDCSSYKFQDALILTRHVDVVLTAQHYWYSPF